MSGLVSFADAGVALRSFPRRYGELVAGVKGDDSWDRLVRWIAPTSSAATVTVARSALGWTALATARLHSLRGLLTRLSAEAHPAFSFAEADTRASEPSATASIEDVLRALSDASVAAADALAKRRPEDAERVLRVDGASLPVGALVDRVVKELAANLRSVQAAIEAAGRS